MKLELNEAQAVMLRELLDSAYRDMKYEVAASTVSTFKDALKDREVVLKGLLDLVGGPLPDRS